MDSHGKSYIRRQYEAYARDPLEYIVRTFAERNTDLVDRIHEHGVLNSLRHESKSLLKLGWKGYWADKWIFGIPEHKKAFLKTFEFSPEEQMMVGKAVDCYKDVCWRAKYEKKLDEVLAGND